MASLVSDPFSRRTSTRLRGRPARRHRLVSERLESRLPLAVTTPFTVRYTTNDTGDIIFAANTLMTAPASDPAAANAQNGVGSKVANNDFVMTYVDVDADPTTFNSSRSDLLMPAGSQVLFAGLYWGARTNGTALNASTALRTSVKFMTPGGAYQDLTGSLVGTGGNDYQGFKDVTTLVAGAGAGTYTVANVQAQKDKTDTYAGWSLVVAYRAPGEPARNLTVFDGYASVASSPTSDKTVNIPISGFKAPTAGPVKATLGFIAYEGDLAKTGDSVKFDGKVLSNPANPASDFFNSTISNRGSLVSTKSPNYVNQLGYDADLITADGIIRNGATSATITVTTGGETYYPGVVTSAIEIFAPEIAVVKSVTDDNGGDVVGGDVLTYTMVVTNKSTALDSAINVLLNDAIPTGTTYKPNSLRITAGANAGSKTDAADGDQAQFVAGANAVRFQLGTGAGGSGTSGGSLAPGGSTTVTFQVTVNAGLPPLTLIENTANVSYTGATSALPLNATGFADIATQGAADLAVTKTDGATQYVPGTTTTYTIVVTNRGPSNVVGASVVDTFPSQIQGATWTAAYSAGSAFSNPTSGSGNIDTLIDLLSGGTATFTVTAPIRAGSFGDLTNTVTVANPAGVPDPDPSNNSATDIDTFLAPAGLLLDKTVEDLNGGFVQAGDVLRYLMIVRNTTPGVAAAMQEAAANVILTDVVPVNTTFKPGSLRVVYGANAGTKTDAVDADQGEYISGTNTVQFQLGTGAGAGTGTPVGGTLAAGTYTEVWFDVTVNAGIPDSTVITNTATVTATGATSGLPISATDTAGIATAPAADLRIAKQATTTFTPGGTITYILTASNRGPSAVTGAVVTDSLPAALSGATWTVTYSGGASGPASGTGSINATIDLTDHGTARFVVTATVDADFPLDQVLTNTATITGPGGIPDPNPDDNTASVTSTPVALTDLAVTKTDGQTRYVPGQSVTYTITVTNAGPSFASQAAVVDTLDPAIVASASWTAVFTGAGSAGTLAGSGSINENIDLAPGGTAVYTVVAQTLADATGPLVNTVTVSTSDLSNDPNPTNNTATDTDDLWLPAELQVEKSVLDVNGGTVLANDRLTYTIVVTNPAAPAGGGRDTAITVTVADVIPTGTTYAGNLTTTQGSVTGSQGAGIAGTLGSLAPGDSVTITFDVTVDGGTPAGTLILNNAFADGTGQISQQPLEGEAGVGVVTAAPLSDLRIVKTATPTATYVPGQPLVYTIVVSNLGPNTATNARVLDDFPVAYGTASWNVSYAGGASGPASGSGTSLDALVTVPVGGTATFTVTGGVSNEVRPWPSVLTNVVTVTPAAGASDPDPSNNVSETSNRLAPVSDLQVVKTDGKATYVPGAPVVYTITVTNNGPSFVSGAHVTDSLDAVRITSASWTAVFTGSGAAGIASGTGSIDEYVNLPVGGTAVYTLTAQTSSAATGTLVNTASVAPPQGTIDPNLDNNESADVNTLLPPAKLVVTKSVRDLNGGFLVAGDTLRYTITVSNNPGVSGNTENALNVILNDVIPTNTTYKAGTLKVTGGANAGSKTDAVDADQGEYIGGSRTVRFQLGTGAGAGTGTPVGGRLSGGQSTTVTFDVIVNAGIPLSTLITNTATATATGQVSGSPLEGSGTVGITTAAGADLAVVKTGPATVTPGNTVTYQLVVTNAGPGTSTNALVQDALPAGLTGGTWTATYSGGGTGPASGSGGVNASVTLPKSGRATFSVTATVSPTFRGTLSNTATVTPTDGDPDPNPNNNTSTTTSTATPVADLAIVKTDSSATYIPGQPVVYTITVTNNGPSFVSGAAVADAFPATHVLAASWSAVFTGTGSSGATAGNGQLDERITLAPGGTAVYTVTCLTRPGVTTSLVNTATVAAPSGTTDPNPGNNSSTDTDTVVLPAKLAVTKTVEDLDGGDVEPGDYLRYTIVVGNNVGATLPVESATGVVLTDAIPANAIYATSGIAGVTAPKTTRGTVTGDPTAGVVADIGTLAGGQSATIVFYVQVDPGAVGSTIVSNTAVADGTGAVTGNRLTGTDNVGVITPNGADLVIEKTGPIQFTPGGSLTYDIVVTNLGPSTANGARVVDTLPVGLENASWTAAYAGNATGNASGSGSIDELVNVPVGGVVTYTITADIDSRALGELVNTAFVINPDGTPDPNQGDNSSESISTPIPETVMTVGKTDGRDTYKPGDVVTYTITVTNAGPSFAQTALIRDVLDPAVVDVAAATWTAVFTGSYSSGNTIGTGSIDEVIDLAVGGTAVYTVVAPTLATATTNLVNTVELTAPDGSTASATDTDVFDYSPSILLGTDIGCDSTPLVQVVDPVTGLPVVQFYAYEPGFRGGAHVFGYDVTGDGIPEIVTAPGPGRPGEVRVFTQTGTPLPAYSFFPYGPAWTAGVEIAGGSVTGVGRTELITGQQQRGPGTVRIFTVNPGSGVVSTPIREVAPQPFGAKFRGGVTVAAADVGTFVNGAFQSGDPDGIAEVIVGSGPGIPATVNTYSAVPSPPALVNTVRAIAPTFQNGVAVAVLPSAPGVADRYMVSAGASGGSKVETYTGIGKVPSAAFAAFAGAAGQRGDVWTAAIDDTRIYSVQGQFGKLAGINRNTSPSGGVSSTLSGSTNILPPLRISVLRRAFG